MKNYLLIEDDCAPDAYEYFNKDLEKITGHTKKEFIQGGLCVKEKGGLGFSYQLHDYTIEWTQDDPYWKLYKS